MRKFNNDSLDLMMTGITKNSDITAETKRLSSIRKIAKTNFLFTISMLEMHYHLALFLLTFEKVLACSMDASDHLSFKKVLCTIL